MSFDDLPPDWPDRPLTDPALRGDVVDLFLSDSDRARRSLLVLLCDDDHRALQPVVINDIPHTTTSERRAAVFRFLEEVPTAAVVVALGLPTTLRARGHVRSWERATRLMCERLGITLLGFHLATLDGGVETRTAA